MNKKKIALFGPIGAGKTTTANRIKDLYEDVEVFSFATPFKKLAEQILGRPINKATDRLLLVHLGQGMRSDLIKFMGRRALIDLLGESLPPFDSQLEKHATIVRLYHVINDFIKENPNWGYQNFWVDFTIKEIENSNCKIAVIDDLRFTNEYDALQGAGFAFAHIKCPQTVRVGRLLQRDGKYDANAELHPSEQEWKRFDTWYTIYTHDFINTDSLEGREALDNGIRYFFDEITGEEDSGQ